MANWEDEFHRWMGAALVEMSVAKVGKAAANLAAEVQLLELVGTTPPHHKILIVSYEPLHTHGRALCTGAGVDVLVADEAHVLAGDGARAKVVRSVPARARLLVTGTPLSNNLLELYRLYDLARPGVLGQEVHFRADFVSPIAASSEEGACIATKAVGRVASARLAAVAAEMQLGRKGAEVERGLPPRHTFLVMCRPTALQRQLVLLCNPRSPRITTTRHTCAHSHLRIFTPPHLHTSTPSHLRTFHTSTPVPVSPHTHPTPRVAVQSQVCRRRTDQRVRARLPRGDQHGATRPGGAPG